MEILSEAYENKNITMVVIFSRLFLILLQDVNSLQLKWQALSSRNKCRKLFFVRNSYPNIFFRVQEII